jgi:cytochrome oxidase Cu insertion factor (SCO1/SenC/PrrC family)
MNLDRRERWALAAMGVIGAITVGWWALAFWPTPDNSPDWLLRARNVCFGSTQTGLPNAGGWVLLIGQPAGMLGVLVVAWWSEVRGGLLKLAGSNRGRAVLALVGLSAATGLIAAGVRVAEARQLASWSPDDLALPVTYPRLDREAPTLALLDQDGSRVSLEAFVGRPVLVTFGFGHCETVCPLVIHNARMVQEELGAVSRPVLLVITLDPWRDTPSRLPHLMNQWELGDDAFVLGGSVEEVNDALDAWNVARERDLASGDIVHPALTFIVDAKGRLAYATSGDRNALLDLLDGP